ncbi:MAG TPA: FAD-dependent oxidoreductase [Naasia sp.]|jgi:NADH dehydrogenase FAD-containing subunit
MFRTVIVGGGYAGVLAANRLAASGRGDSLGVTLINARPDFVERIRLHELVAGSRRRATLPFSRVLHPGVRLVVASAVRIDTDSRRVMLDMGGPVEYDALIYAVGSDGPREPGVLSVAGLDGAAAARRAVAGLGHGRRVQVLGGGLTAIETSAEIAERRPDLRVTVRTTGTLAAGVSDGGRSLLRSRLGGLGIEVVEGTANVAPDDPQDALALACAGFSVPGLAADSGLPTDPDGRLLVGADLGVHGHDGLYGAGDAARIDPAAGMVSRMSCAGAMPMGGHAADAILARMDGGTVGDLSSGFLAQCISLGRRDALIQFVGRDDTPTRWFVGGSVGALAKETVNRQTIRWLRGEARRSGSYAWPKGPVRGPLGHPAEAMQ